jgi:dihydrofolate reductase
MYRTIVVAFSTLDGIIEDPDGSAGTTKGGWAFHHGPEAVAGDKFKLGAILETGVLVFGHQTWRLFSNLFPSRVDDFSMSMNRIPKLVASRAKPDLSAWGNSTLITGDLMEAVANRKSEQDVVVIGSASVVHALATQDLIDEYRIIVFPELIGRGTKLFGSETAPTLMHLLSAEVTGPTVLLRYERVAPTDESAATPQP